MGRAARRAPSCQRPAGISEGKPIVTQNRPQGQLVGDGDDPPLIDTSVANPARVWNYWLGGKDNFAADREAAERVLEVLPSMPLLARLARRQLIDAVQQLTDNYGIRQFLDIGAGLPTADNVHEVAQRAAPASRVVYVDKDPVVIRHAQALLTSSAEGRTDYVQSDLRDVSTILAGAARTLDFTRPIAILLIGVLHFIPDADDPYGIVAQLMDAVPSGSFLVIGHGASDIHPEAAAEMMRRYNDMASAPIMLRSREQVSRFFDRLDMIGPGLVPLSEWRQSDQVDAGVASGLLGYCGIGRKR